MALTLLRHGEPEIAKGTCYGQSDVTTRPLDDGRFSALMNALPGSFARIDSSPLIRCMLSLIAGPDNIRDTEAMDLLVRCAAHPFVVVRPAALADAPAKGAYRATEATGAALFPISRADVAKFLFDALTDKQWDYKAVQLYAA